ncbi:SRPBCC domain-containing protein [Pontimicrobium sp. MEBiC06410]
MQQKTKINAENDKQELIITREFDLPLELLFKAYEDKDLFEQWMGSNLVHFEFKEYGKYHFETKDPKGNVIFSGKGTFHGFIPNAMIVRTFEMDVFSMPAQLEFLNFKTLTSNTSELTMHIIFKSVEIRNELLKKPFAIGLDMAYNRLEKTLSKLK